MAHRVNVMLDDEVWEQLKQVPAGERSRVVNESLAHLLDRRRRLQAVEAMDALRQALAPAEGTSEAWVRAERERA